jgi:hypothetical protein
MLSCGGVLKRENRLLLLRAVHFQEMGLRVDIDGAELPLGSCYIVNLLLGSAVGGWVCFFYIIMTDWQHS